MGDDAWRMERIHVPPAGSELDLKLLDMNAKLGELETKLHELLSPLEPALRTKVRDEADPMADFNLECKLDFHLAEDDPTYSEEDDNILVSKCGTMAISDDAHSLSGKYRMGYNDRYVEGVTDKGILSVPHSWLFHELYDHGYGPLDGPALSFKDCARIGRVWVDVVITQQYVFDLKTGKLIKE
jgi:hypothetical protein